MRTHGLSCSHMNISGRNYIKPKTNTSAVIVIFAVLSFSTAGGAQEKPEARQIEEKMVAQVDFPSLVEQSFLVSHDGRRVGYRIRKEEKQIVVMNGEEGK